MIGCKKNIVEAVSCVKRIFGKLTKHDTPMMTGDHPKLDGLAILDDKEHQKNQMLIVCSVSKGGTLGTGTLCFFCAEGQLEVDLSSKLQEQFLEAKEVLDDSIPDPIFGELAIMAYVDSDHAHDKVGCL
eukprot:15325353-Ditylum_brightwellii.AAC.1